MEKYQHGVIVSPFSFLPFSPQPQQPRRLPPPHSTGAIGGGRSFGTPLSNCHSAAANNTNSNGASKSAAKSSKKLVRARKLLQTHRSTPLPPPQLPKQYTVTFLPGPIGMQLEPANDIFGCRVSAIVDGGPEEPGQARKSQEIQEGDILVELNDEPIFHREYDDIIDSLRELSNKPRKVVFRNTPVVPANESSPAPTVQPSPAINTPKVTNHTNSVSFTYEPFSTPVVSPPQASVETPNTESNSETVLPGPSPGDVVLDMKNTSDSIDSSPAITPSKVKNLSQEDLELGLGQLRGTNADNDTNETATQDSKPPLSNVLRNVYQNVVIGKVGSFDFGKLGEALTGGHVSSQELEESVERKTKLLQHLNNASSAITDGENQQILTRETLQNESEKVRFCSVFFNYFLHWHCIIK